MGRFYARSFIDEDIKHLRAKLKREKNILAQKKIRRQIELLEDSIVIYREYRPSENNTWEYGRVSRHQIATLNSQVRILIFPPSKKVI